MDLLLDSSVLIDLLRGHNARKELLAGLVHEGHRLATTAINVSEIYAGLRPGEESRTALLLDSLECHSLDADSGKLAGLLKTSWAKKGMTIPLPDALIAAIAIENNCTLMTDNGRDFPMPELKLYRLPS